MNLVFGEIFGEIYSIVVKQHPINCGILNPVAHFMRSCLLGGVYDITEVDGEVQTTESRRGTNKIKSVWLGSFLFNTTLTWYRIILKFSNRVKAFKDDRNRTCDLDIKSIAL